MSRNPERRRHPPRVAIIGAGWAGLAAAFTLKRAGWHAEVFEQSPVLGGRARKAVIPRRGVTLDNGQHLLIGAYRHVLKLMQEIGVDPENVLLRVPLQLRSLDGRLCLAANTAHPRSVRLPMAILGMKGLRAVQKFSLVRALFRLQLNDWRVAPDTTVLEWLQGKRQPALLTKLFWEPLCVAMLNTPITDASMAQFARVLKDSLAAGPEASDLIFPRVDLSALWPEALLSQLTIHTNSPVRRINATSAGYRLYTGDRQPLPANDQAVHKADPNSDVESVFDVVILATPPLVCHRLLSGMQQDAAAQGISIRNHTQDPTSECDELSQANDTEIPTLMHRLRRFQYHAIATLTVFLETPFPLDGNMYLLREDRERGFDGQWLFNRSRFMHTDSVRVDATDRPNEGSARPDLPHAISVVISHADHLAGTPRDNIARAILEQIRSQLPASVTLPQVLGHELIMEKRATFAATPGLARPGNATPYAGVYLAGDWTDTGYPGVLEGAVLSGMSAARAVQAELAEHQT